MPHVLSKMGPPEVSMDTTNFSNSSSSNIDGTKQKGPRIRKGSKAWKEITDEIATPIMAARNESQMVDFDDTKSRKAADAVLKKFKDIQDTCPQEVFIETLLRAWRPVYLSDTEISSEYIVNLESCFFYVFTKWSTDTEQDTQRKTNLVHILLERFTELDSDSSARVRRNLTKACARILESIDDIEKLPERVIEKLEGMFLRRVRDINASVRVYGAKGLRHFQFEEDPSVCDISKALRFHCTYDPSAEVREMAMNSLHFNRVSLPVIFKRVWDQSEGIRVEALKYIARNVSIDAISLEQREKILVASLEDLSNKVKDAGRLVADTWLAECGGDVISFMSKLDVIVGRKAVLLSLNHIFKDGTIPGFDKVDKGLFGPSKLIPMKKLSNEVAYYWKYLVAKFRSQAVCAQVIVPDAHDVCVYINRYLEVYEKKYSNKHGPIVLEQLLKILHMTSQVAEEGGRKVIFDTITTVLDFTYIDVVQVEAIYDIISEITEGNKMESTILNLIEKMLLESKDDPLFLQSQKNKKEKVVAEVEEEDESTAARVEFGMLIHKRHKLIGAKAKALLDNDYLLAAELQAQIDEVTAKTDEMRPKRLSEAQAHALRPTDSGSPNGADEAGNDMDEDTEGEEEEHCVDANSFLPAVLQFVLAIFLKHLIKRVKFTPMTETFFKAYAVPSLLSNTSEVRRLAVHIIGAAGVLCDEAAPKHMIVCLQAVLHDEERIAIQGLRGMFDMVMKHGFGRFEGERVQDMAENALRKSFSSSLVEENGCSLLQHFLNQLDSNNQKFVTLAAEGLMKLAFQKQFFSVAFVVRILTMWANPTYGGSELFRTMTTWIGIYVKLGDEQASTVADALLPALRKVIYAGKESPLVNVPPEKLVSFVASSTAPSVLKNWVTHPVGIHEKMACNVLREMNTLAASKEVVLFAKSLKFFELHGLAEDSLERLMKKSKRLLRVSSNSRVKLSLNAFWKRLKSEQLRNGASETVISGENKAKNVDEGSDEGNNDQEVPTDEETEEFPISDTTSDEELFA